MNTQPQTQNKNSYEGYSEKLTSHPDGLSMQKTEAELELERELLLNEYRNDKEAILLAIKQALKERNYKEAQEFVFKYRAAAKMDENFAVLARMTAQGLESEKKIEKVVTVLDATPDEDYETRIALCERILKIVPDHEVYQKELERCKQALNGNNTQMNAQTDAHLPAKKNKYFTTFLTTFLVIFLLIASMLIIYWTMLM